MESNEREGKFSGHNNNDEELDAAMALAALVEGRQIRTVERDSDPISWSLRRRRSGSLVVVNEQGTKLREKDIGLSNLGQEDAKGLVEAPLVSGVDQAKVEKAFQQGLAGIAQLLQEERPLIRAPSFPPQLSTNTLLPQLSLASQSSFGGGGLQLNGGELQPQLSAPSAFLAAIAASLPPTTSQPWSAFPTLANPLSNPICAPPAYPFLERQDGPSSDGPDSPSPKLVNFLPMAKQASDEAQETAARGFEELVAVKEESRGLGFGANGKRRPMHSRRKRSAPDDIEDPDPVKEAQRLRRIQANRESARKTIMRKQALCKKLSTEAKRLGDENSDLKSKVEATHSELQRLMMEQAKLRDELLAAHSEGGDPLDAHPSTSAPLLPDLSDERRSNEGVPKPTLLADLDRKDSEMWAPAVIKASRGSLTSIPEGRYPDADERLREENLLEGNRSTPDKSNSLDCSIKSGEGSNVKKSESNQEQTDRVLIKTGSNESVSGERPLKEKDGQTLVRQDTASLLSLLDSGTGFEKEAPSSDPGGPFSRVLGEGEREPVPGSSRSTLLLPRAERSKNENEKPTKPQTPPLPLSLSLLQSIASELRSDKGRESPQPLLHAQSLPPKPQDSWLSLRPQTLQRHLSAPKELIQRQLANPDSLRKADSSSVAFEEAAPKQSVNVNLTLGNGLWRSENGSGNGDAFAQIGANGRTQSGQGWDMHTWNELTKAGSGVGFWESKEVAGNDGLLCKTQPAAQVKSETGLYSLYSRGGGRRGSVSLHIGPLPVVDAVTAAEARKRRREVTKSKFGASGNSGAKVPKTSNAKAARQC